MKVKDLEIRDRVINKIKDAFYEAKEKDYSKDITGEIVTMDFGVLKNQILISLQFFLTSSLIITTNF